MTFCRICGWWVCRRMLSHYLRRPFRIFSLQIFLEFEAVRFPRGRQTAWCNRLKVFCIELGKYQWSWTFIILYFWLALYRNFFFTHDISIAHSQDLIIIRCRSRSNLAASLIGKLGWFYLCDLYHLLLRNNLVRVGLDKALSFRL